MDNELVKRPSWLEKINSLWKKTSIVWLSGVRRSGKTTLVKEIKDATYINCDLPSEVERLRDPETFYSSCSSKIVIFDEIQNLANPSIVLKIGADEFSHFKILATGSSTLAATEKFSDSLTGRKRSMELSPVLYTELNNFGIKDLSFRMIRGGLPPSLLSKEIDYDFFAEWLDSYYARDIRELFKIEKRSNFLKLVEILLASNGDLINLSKLATMTELSRPTVMTYLEAIEISHVVHIVRPFHGGKRKEIVKQGKVYGFDTGFVAYVKGYKHLRADDQGLLWENITLDMLKTIFPRKTIKFWRDENKNEIDFIVDDKSTLIAIEAKMDYKRFNPKAFKLFNSLYATKKNFVVAPNVRKPFVKKYDSLEVHFVNLSDLKEACDLK